MKYLGTQNIINEHDIQLDENVSLSDKLNGMLSQINLLKRNTKFLYAHGGTGSGKGGGGGSSTPTEYSVYATLNGIQINLGNNIVLGDEGEYALRVKINNPGGVPFKLTGTYYTVGASGSRITNRISETLNIDNSYLFTKDITLNSNASLTLEVTNGDLDKSFNCTYVTKPYTFNTVLQDVEGNLIGNELFVEQYKDTGIDLAINYDIAVDAQASYLITFNGESTEAIALQKSKGTEIFHIPKEFFKEENAGSYIIDTKINIVVTNSGTFEVSKPITLSVIPKSLYLFVEAETGLLYSEEVPEGSERYEYDAGTVRVKVRVYQGVNLGRTYTIRYTVNGDSSNDPVGVMERQLNTIRFDVSQSGRNEITFQVGDYTKTYYFYVKENLSEVTWYREGTVGIFNYFRMDDRNGPFTNLPNSIILTTVNSQTRTFNGISKLNVSGDIKFDTHIAFGILYSEINNDNLVFIRGYNMENGSKLETLSISNLEINVGGQQKTTLSYFLNKESEYSLDNPLQFHLLDIYSRYIKTVGNDDYYLIDVYIDGYLEASSAKLTTIPIQLTLLDIMAANCFYNLIEIGYTQRNIIREINERVKQYTADIISYLYWLKYRERFYHLNVLEELNIAQNLENFTLSAEGNVECSYEAMSNLALSISTPVMLFIVDPTRGNYTIDQFLKSLNSKEYGENDSFPFDVGVAWSGGKSLLMLVIPPNNSKFTTDIQGSSTKKNKSKNFELYLESTDESEDALIPLFSPNFSKTDSKSFLPEKSFTLKADVVDSSHSNNTSIGKFVNEVCTPFRTGETGYYRNYIKNCLDGFPFVLFLTLDDGQETKNYYLGVYNFNLGRKSYFNLGYKSLSPFLDSRGNGLLTPASSGFTFFEITSSQDAFKKGVIVAEVLGNDPRFDFSLWDTSILFLLPNPSGKEDDPNPDSNYMLGDIEIKPAGYQNKLQAFVRTVAGAGLYIFSQLGKNFGDYVDGASYSLVDSNGLPNNQVPDNKIQYIRTVNKSGADQATYEYTPKEGQFIGTENDLRNLLLDNENTGVNRRLDYDSLSEYYTICMAFGLVDSVLKNLNIKTWSAEESSDLATFYTAFYDMDTSLGKSNSGEYSSYFAFSDYWELKNTEEDGIITPSGINIYRDYYPKKEVGLEAGYDIPSSFLFAVAKYARLFGLTSDVSTNFPQQLWARWRHQITNTKNHLGCLKNADEFVDNYFAGNLNKVYTPLVNFNYRSKYFIMTDTSMYDADLYQKFNGTGIARVRDWLRGRFHILDAYFNVLGTSIPIEVKDGSSYKSLEWNGAVVTEPIHNILAIDNPDIIVSKDIFSTSGGLQYTEHFNFIIKSSPNSPLIIISPLEKRRYITGTDPTNIIFSTNGNQTLTFGGSGNWTYIDKLNSFLAGGSRYIKSNKIEEINGDGGSFSDFTIISDSVKKIALNSMNYSGTITLDGSDGGYSNLDNIDIHNSKILLSLNNLNITGLNISNIDSASISVLNCRKLTDLRIGTSKIAKIVLNPVPASIAKDFKLSNTSILNLSVETDNGGSFAIENDSTLSTLSVKGFNKITVTNCSKLNKVLILDLGNLTVLTIYITKCSARAETLTITSNDDNAKDNTIDLSTLRGLNLVSFNETLKFTECILPDNTKLAESCFKSTLLTYLKGACIITGTNTFRDCSFFTLKDPTNNYTLLSIGTTSLESTFYCASKGVLTLADARNFISRIPTNVTNIKLLFRNLNIAYDYNNLYSDRNKGLENISIIDLSRLSNLTNADYAFYQNNITVWNKKLFNFGSSNGISMNGTFVPSSHSVQVELGFAENMKDKVVGQFPFSYSSSILSIRVIDLSNISFDTSEAFQSKNFAFRDLFPAMARVTTFGRFNLDTSATIDMEDSFTSGWDNLEVVDYVMKDAAYANVTGYDGLLFNLKKLYRINQSFSFGDDHTPIDWYKFVDWNTFLKNANSRTNRPLNPWTSGIVCQFPKYISEENYNEIWELLSTYLNITDLWSFFYNCRLVKSNNQFSIPVTGDLNTTGLTYTFMKFSIGSSIESDPVYMELVPNLFKNLPNVTSVGHTFNSTRILNYIELNFFNKRYEESADCYYLIGDSYIKGKLILYKYKSTISNINSCFANCMFLLKSFPGQVKDNKVYIENVVVKDSNRVIANGNSYYDYYYIKTTVLDSDGQPIDTYTRKEIPLDPVTFDLDRVNLKINGVKVHGGHDNNISLIADGKGSNFNIDNPSNLFVAPDIFYGCSNTCAYLYVFSNSNLEGLLPDHLFSDVNSRNLTPKSPTQANIVGIFTNLNITPRLVATRQLSNGDNITSIYTYIYVPDNFIGTTDLSGVFTFHLNIPEYNASRINEFYILSSNSINRNVTLMSNALPSVQNSLTSEITGWYNNRAAGSPFVYNIMGTVKEDGSISSGLDMSKFTKLNLDYLIGPQLANWLNGNIFNSSFAIDKALKSKADSWIISISGGDSSNLHLSATAKLPIATANFANKNFLVTARTSGEPISRSQVNGGEQYYEDVLRNSKFVFE